MTHLIAFHESASFQLIALLLGLYFGYVFIRHLPHFAWKSCKITQTSSYRLRLKVLYKFGM